MKHWIRVALTTLTATIGLDRHRGRTRPLVGSSPSGIRSDRAGSRLPRRGPFTSTGTRRCFSRSSSAERTSSRRSVGGRATAAPVAALRRRIRAAHLDLRADDVHSIQRAAGPLLRRRVFAELGLLMLGLDCSHRDERRPRFRRPVTHGHLPAVPRRDRHRHRLPVPDGNARQVACWSTAACSRATRRSANATGRPFP